MQIISNCYNTSRASASKLLLTISILKLAGTIAYKLSPNIVIHYGPLHIATSHNHAMETVVKKLLIPIGI